MVWGTEIAIKKLRPGASFELANSSFTKWDDLEGRLPPTWKEVLDQVKKDQLAAEKWLEQNKE
jgi:hypothetical protein